MKIKSKTPIQNYESGFSSTIITKLISVETISNSRMNFQVIGFIVIFCKSFSYLRIVYRYSQYEHLLALTYHLIIPKTPLPIKPIKSLKALDFYLVQWATLGLCN